jgi:hypothetical protein
MCGSGEKADRRPIDPPPIVRLRISGPDQANTNALVQSVRRPFPPFLSIFCSPVHAFLQPYFFCFASLCNPDTEEELYLLPGSKTRHLTGTVVSSLYHLRDPSDNSYAAFFVFPDIGVRVEGLFRFKMTMYEIVG